MHATLSPSLCVLLCRWRCTGAKIRRLTTLHGPGMPAARAQMQTRTYFTRAISSVSRQILCCVAIYTGHCLIRRIRLFTTRAKQKQICKAKPSQAYRWRSDGARWRRDRAFRLRCRIAIITLSLPVAAGLLVRFVSAQHRHHLTPGQPSASAWCAGWKCRIRMRMRMRLSSRAVSVERPPPDSLTVSLGTGARPEAAYKGKVQGEGTGQEPSRKDRRTATEMMYPGRGTAPGALTPLMEADTDTDMDTAGGRRCAMRA